VGFAASVLHSILTIAGVVTMYWALDWYMQIEYHVFEAPGYVLITGANSGIGYETTLSLADMGFSVFAGFRKDADGKMLEASHKNIIPIKLDVTNGAHIEEAMANVTQRLAETPTLPFVALINNAGKINPLPTGLIPDREIESLFDVNAIGPMKLTNVFLPTILQHKSRIINIGSVAGFAYPPWQGVYAVTKWAMRGYTNVFRAEMIPHGVSVSLIEPGIVNTPLLRNHIQDTVDFDILSVNNSYLQQAYEPFMLNFMKAVPILAKMPGFSGPAEPIVDSIIDAMMNKYPRDVYTPGTMVFGKPASAIRKIFSVMPRRFMDFMHARGEMHMVEKVLGSEFGGQGKDDSTSLIEQDVCSKSV